MRQCMRVWAQIENTSIARIRDTVVWERPQATQCRAFATINDGSFTAAIRAPGKQGVLLAFHSDHHEVPLEEKHRFPMLKYRLTRLALEGDASVKDLIEMREAPQATEEDLALAHDAGYVQSFFEGQLSPKKMRSIGFPWSQGLVSRARASAGGTLAATRALLEWQLPFTANIAGGTHHAFADRGEGFCVFNDIAVSARMAMAEQGIERILVIDLDVHQGNGTSAIFGQDDRVTTFDIHGDKNYPWKTRSSSTYDVALRDATGDEEYLALLENWLPRLFSEHRPQLVFFQAGVDAMEKDSFGRLSLTRRGLLERNTMVLSKCLEESVPTVITMGGGYSRPIDNTVEAHADVYRTAARLYPTM